MRIPGQTSGRQLLWMIREDAVAFGDDFADTIKGAAHWYTIPGGGAPPVFHERLGAILPEGAWGAYRVRLKSGGPILQYSPGRIFRDYGKPIAAPESGAFLMSSELAWVWVPEEEDDLHREAFPALVKSVKAALFRHTSPGRVLRQGKPYRSARIGKHAEDFIRKHALQLRDQAWMGTDIVLAAPR